MAFKYTRDYLTRIFIPDNSTTNTSNANAARATGIVNKGINFYRAVLDVLEYSGMISAAHPEATITGSLAPFSWNQATQTGNVPLASTLTNNLNGTYTFVPGNGATTTTFMVAPPVTATYNSDLEASINGIALNQAYWCGPTHETGTTEGVLKLRVI